jgi:hypothetical protein
MSDASVPTKIAPANRLLTSAKFHHLAAVPPEVEWFANIRNKSTRRAYETAIEDFMGFAGIALPEEFRAVTSGKNLTFGTLGKRSKLAETRVSSRYHLLRSDH